MESSLAQLALVARHYTNAAVQISNAYNNEQAKLGLDAVLTPERLQTTEGTRESLAVLAQLRALTDAHKVAFGQYITASTRDINAAVEQLPQPQQDEQRNGMIASINRQLALQAEFYVNRDRWIVAAAGICELIEANRDTVVFSADGIDFEYDEDLEQFTSLLAVIDDIHHVEVAAMEERMACIQRAMTVLAA
jgi:hypothetical protein